MPKVMAFCHFYNGFTAETQSPQSFFYEEPPFFALCVFAVS